MSDAAQRDFVSVLKLADERFRALLDVVEAARRVAAVPATEASHYSRMLEVHDALTAYDRLAAPEGGR